MARSTRRVAFTLVELLAVVAIIGILMIFILAAASGAQAEAKMVATKGLIAKLDAAMNTLIDTLQQTKVDIDSGTTNAFFQPHVQWAAIYSPGPLNANPTGLMGQLNDRGTTLRAQVLANYDYLRANLPDVFFVQDKSLSAGTYPLNFAQQPFASVPNQRTVPWDYVLPIGTNWTQFNDPSTQPTGTPIPVPGTGIYGASYTAAAGLYKNLGNLPSSVFPRIPGTGFPPQAVLPPGCDGVDNDSSGPGFGLIDDIGEGAPAGSASAASVALALGNHKHITARSEMLYALLVEGIGSNAGVLNRDDFSPNDIADTDQDGLPEFVDAWGNPLQFFRWPIFYPSDIQKGLPQPLAPPYANAFQPREVDPYDPNQQLTGVNWWSTINMGPSILASKGPQNPAYSSFMSAIADNQGNTYLSGPGAMFNMYFHSLVEPLNYLGSNPSQFWDRSSTFYPRRAFYTRFLILSSGPDGIPGVPILPEALFQNATSADSVSFACQLEGQAAPYDLLSSRLSKPNVVNDFTDPQHSPGPPNPINTSNPDASGQLYIDLGLDDITNHNLNSTAGPAQ